MNPTIGEQLVGKREASNTQDGGGSHAWGYDRREREESPPTDRVGTTGRYAIYDLS